MRILLVSAFWIVCAPLGGAQTAHARHAQKQNETQSAPAKPKQDFLPQATLDFKPVGDGLQVSAQNAFLGYPICGTDGTIYFNAITLPKGERRVFAVSPKDDKGEVNNFNLASVMGLVNVTPRMMDADGSDLYVLVGAAKSEELINHDVQPDSADVGKYTRLFILHFRNKASAPDVIPLNLSFQPKQFAATSDGKFIFLGLERTNQTAVLAVVDGSGELERYIDAYFDFGTSDSMVANAPQRLKNQYKTMPVGAPLDFVLTDAQFVHYRGSLLLLMPGAKAKVYTIRSGGAIETTTLHLPVGLEAESIIPSDNDWLIRAKDGSANGKEVIVMVDPSDGKALRIIRSPQFGVNAITCAHDGDYYGIHWPKGENGNEKAFLMEAAE